jgi:Ser/Thr protein kinase RdoA (MazF antagonist)
MEVTQLLLSSCLTGENGERELNEAPLHFLPPFTGELAREARRRGPTARCPLRLARYSARSTSPASRGRKTESELHARRRSSASCQSSFLLFSCLTGENGERELNEAPLHFLPPFTGELAREARRRGPTARCPLRRARYSARSTSPASRGRKTESELHARRRSSASCQSSLLLFSCLTGENGTGNLVHPPSRCWWDIHSSRSCKSSLLLLSCFTGRKIEQEPNSAWSSHDA